MNRRRLSETELLKPDIACLWSTKSGRPANLSEEFTAYNQMIRETAANGPSPAAGATLEQL
jgi:hypothetical protein